MQKIDRHTVDPRTPRSLLSGLSARTRGHTRHRAGEEGTILVVVMVTAIAMFGLVFTGTLQLQSYKNKAEAAFRMGSQARNVARSGLIDAFSWFRSQPTQPVVDFAPVRDENAVPPVLDTDDPSLGLVREFQMSGSIWARYEVRLHDPNKPLMTVRDVSALRGYSGAGQAWTLSCWGIVFRKADPQKAYNESPNLILGTAWAFTEIRRITLSPPGNAAVCSDRGASVSLGPNTRIQGNNASGVAYPPGTGTPLINGELDGVNPYDIVTGYDGSIEAVFGVSFNELESLADQIVEDAADFPDPFPPESLVIVKDSVTFDSQIPLRGTGVVIITGNCTLDASSLNFFNGVLYVMGNLLIKAPSFFRGTIIGNGNVTVTGQADVAEIEYDPDLIDDLMISMGQYRISKAIRYGSTDMIRDLQIN